VDCFPALITLEEDALRFERGKRREDALKFPGLFLTANKPLSGYGNFKGSKGRATLKNRSKQM
jgi:hypothetical protein